MSPDAGLWLLAGFVLGYGVSWMSNGRAQARLLDHVLRIQRREAGMPELPRQPQAAPQDLTIPDEIEELVEMYDSEQIKTAIRTELLYRARHGSSWATLYKELFRQVGPVPTEED